MKPAAYTTNILHPVNQAPVTLNEPHQETERINTIEYDWDVEIKPKTGLLELNLKDLWRYRDLISLFVRRDFLANYKQTILGPIWFIIQPVLTTLMFTIVFARVAKISTDGLPPILFYLSGLTLWQYFSASFTKTSYTFSSNTNLFSKVYFPRLAVPVSIILSNFMTFFIQFLLLVVIALFYAFTGTSLHTNIYVLLIPVLLLLMAALSLGLGIIISSITIKYKDLMHLIAFGVQLLMYATPIIYPLSSVKEQYRLLVIINPITPLVETFRYAILGTGTFNLYHLLYSALCSIVILFAGIIMFNKVEKNFMDVV